MAFDAEQVFDRDRHAQQRPSRVRLALGQLFVGCVGLRQRVRGIVTEKRFDFAIHALDLVEAGLHGFARGTFAFGEFGGEFGNGELIEHEKNRTRIT